MSGADRENIVGLPRRSPLRGGGRFDDSDQLPWLEAVDEEDEPILSDGRRKFLLVVGALIVLSLFGSLLFYVYGQRLQSNSTSWEIPVMRASEGPTKIEPTDRGGLNVPDQDRLVFDRMSGDTSATTSERVAEGPEQPLARPTETTPAVSTNNTADRTDAANISETDATQERSVQSVVPPAQTDQQQLNSFGSRQTQPAPSQQTEARGVDNSAAANVSPSPSQVTPLVTDAQTGELRAATRDSSQTGRATLAPQPARAASGFKIQLGAFGSQGSAEAAWQVLQAQYPNELGPLQSELEPLIRVGSPMLFRLRAGVFADRAGAEAACASLQGAGQACFVVSP